MFANREVYQEKFSHNFASGMGVGFIVTDEFGVGYYQFRFQFFVISPLDSRAWEPLFSMENQFKGMELDSQYVIVVRAVASNQKSWF